MPDNPAGIELQLHPSLLRQLRRSGLDPGAPPADTRSWQAALSRIDKLYRESRHDNYLLQRSLAMVSAEMSELAEQVRRSAADELTQADRQIRRLALAVEASVDAIVITDPQARIEYVNPAFSTVTGWSREEALGANPSILQSGQTPPETYASMWQTLRDGRLWSGRLRNRRRPDPADPRGGLEYWALVTISPYFDSDGRTLLGYVAIQRDISEDVALEERHKLAALVSRLRADIAATLHSQAALQDRLAQVAHTTSTAMREITGTDFDVTIEVEVPDPITASTGPLGPGWKQVLESRMGMSIAELEHPLCLQPQAPSRQGAGLPGVLVVPSGPQARAGALLMCTCRGMPPAHLDPAVVESLALAAELISLAGSAEQAKSELEAARDTAESATRAKAQFLATMSHEIRTPMNGVIGMLDLLAETPLNAAQVEKVGLARTSAQSLLTVINDILDFSKIEAGKIELESVAFDVGLLTREVTALFMAHSAGRDVAVRCRVAPVVPHAVRGDPTRVRQVLTNVIGNAVKFTAHGSVTVWLGLDAEQGRPPAQHPGDEVPLVFTVADTGIGMDPATLAQLFQPFSQADASTTRRFGGTGLGLAITGQLVELMGGRIEVSSSLGAGSKFVIRLALPLAQERLEPATPAAPRGAVVGRVLLVEDNVINQKVARSMLTKLGLSVEVAGDGAAALAKLAADDGFSLVLMDCQMPVLDGFAATRAYRSSEAPGQHLPIIALTANALSGAQEECRAAGMDGYLSKPYSREELADVLAQWLGAAAEH